MGKLKQSIPEEAMDALEDVQDGLISYEEWEREYMPTWVDPVEKMGDFISEEPNDKNTS